MSWLCPVCHRSTKYKDIRIDGYFKHILDTVGADVDAVLVSGDDKTFVPVAKGALGRPSAPATPIRSASPAVSTCMSE